MKFPKLNKETSLYKLGAIRLALLEAASTATDYVTEITGGGIMVHPIDDDLSGWKIADTLELIKQGVTAFSVALVSGMAKVVVGEADKSHAEIDYHSLQLVDKEGDTYFHVSDLRGADGVAEITDTFIADGNTGGFNFSLHAQSTDYTVTVDGVEVTSGIEKDRNYIIFETDPAEGSVIVVTYETIISRAKAYTAGLRQSSSSVGPMSFAEGAYVMASGYASHAEGHTTDSRGFVSHAEGDGSVASGAYAHAEGYESTASGYTSHAEGGETVASYNYSHAQNLGTIASSEAQTAIGKYNDANDEYALIIGNGTSADNRSNAYSVAWSGDVHCWGGPDRDETPDSTANGPGYRFLDASGQTIGCVFPRHNASANSVVVEAIRKVGDDMKYGQLYVGVKPSGDPWYYLNGKPEFREAIGLGRTQDNLTLSNTSAGTVTLVRNAIAATVYINAVKLSSALANGSSVQIATVPSGYRPPVNAHAMVSMPTNGFPHGVYAFVNSSGAVSIYNRSGASLATSYAIHVVITYVI